MVNGNSAKAVPARHEVPPQYRWNLEAVFPDETAWETAYRAAEVRLPELESFRGRLGESAATFLHALRLRDEIATLVDRIASYAMLRRAEDATNSTAAAMAERGEGLDTRFGTAVAFYDPEILAMPPERIAAFLAEEPGLTVYRHAIARIERQRGHIRSTEVEEVLAQAADLAASPGTIAGVLEDADLSFAPIRDEQGQEVALAQGNLERYLASPDRRVRREAWESSSDAYLAMQRTFAAALAGGVKKDVFYASARRYPSALEAALSWHAIPPEVFHNLLATVWRNLPTWHRYFRVRRKLLGVDELHAYDLTAPLVPQEPAIPFEEGVELITEALEPLGADYVGIVRQGIADRWVDAMANVGKGGGAFSWGPYGTLPFVSMSYHDDLKSVSTLAHELGHSLHSYHSWQAQPIVYWPYSMFAAETASNMHQALLGASLLARDNARDWTISVIEERMANFLRYLFTMPILAKFELDCHQRVERGEALTADGMNAALFALYQEGYGGEVVLDEPRMGITWARFSHLYMNFYVFQYATGIAAAAALAALIRQEGPPAAARYVAFLRAGGSVDPIEALRRAGIDMRSPEPVQRAYDILAGYVDRLEALAQ